MTAGGMGAGLLTMLLLLSTPIQAVVVEPPHLVGDQLHARIEFQPHEFFPNLQLELQTTCAEETVKGRFLPDGTLLNDAQGRMLSAQVGGGLAAAAGYGYGYGYDTSAVGYGIDTGYGHSPGYGYGYNLGTAGTTHFDPQVRWATTTIQQEPNSAVLIDRTTIAPINGGLGMAHASGYGQLVFSKSLDGGATWSTPSTVSTLFPGHNYVWASYQAQIMQVDDEIVIVFLASPVTSAFTQKAYVSRSTDGTTWSEPTTISSDLVLGLDSVRYGDGWAVALSGPKQLAPGFSGIQSITEVLVPTHAQLNSQFIQDGATHASSGTVASLTDYTAHTMLVNRDGTLGTPISTGMKSALLVSIAAHGDKLVVASSSLVFAQASRLVVSEGTHGGSWSTPHDLGPSYLGLTKTDARYMDGHVNVAWYPITPGDVGRVFVASSSNAWQPASVVARVGLDYATFLMGVQLLETPNGPKVLYGDSDQRILLGARKAEPRPNLVETSESNPSPWQVERVMTGAHLQSATVVGDHPVVAFATTNSASFGGKHLSVARFIESGPGYGFHTQGGGELTYIIALNPSQFPANVPCTFVLELHSNVPGSYASAPSKAYALRTSGGGAAQSPVENTDPPNVIVPPDLPTAPPSPPSPPATGGPSDNRLPPVTQRQVVVVAASTLGAAAIGAGAWAFFSGRP